MNILVAYKKSAFELYSNSEDDYNREFMQSDHPDAMRMRKGHAAQQATLDTVVEVLSAQHHDFRFVHRAELQSERSVDAYDLVIAVGGDGTFLELSHYVEAAPILGVNSDTDSSVGFFASANRLTIDSMLANYETLPRTVVPRMKVTISNNGKEREIPEQILNDVLLANPNPADTTRYQIQNTGERAKHSGLLVGAPAGSTAFVYEEGGEIISLDEPKLEYITRSKRDSQAQFAKELVVHNQTREANLYIDGPHLTYPVGLGDEITFKIGAPLTIIGDLNEKRKKFLEATQRV